MISWSIETDPITDLALAPTSESRLRDLLDGGQRSAVVEAIDSTVNALIAEHGLHEDGAWAFDCTDEIESIIGQFEVIAAVDTILTDSVDGVTLQDARPGTYAMNLTTNSEHVILFAGDPEDDYGQVEAVTSLRTREAIRTIIEAARTGDVSALDARLRVVGSHTIGTLQCPVVRIRLTA